MRYKSLKPYPLCREVWLARRRYYMSALVKTRTGLDRKQLLGPLVPAFRHLQYSSLNRTASDGKLGEALGTRLQASCLHTYASAGRVRGQVRGRRLARVGASTRVCAPVNSRVTRSRMLPYL